MDLGTIRQINIDNEMQASYLDYAMSVIVARALPDVRDGLKPVHRRILYAMYDLGLDPDKPYKKSARIVGEVLGKYHPHGDAAVYEAMVRMAQDFSLRYPLVDGQGNFGSIDGDNAAAMRYTEARLARIAMEMLNDIEKNTVAWTDNFDGTLKEPSVLPAALPNLVVNGASGIAVGMSTNIPPHNLGEVCDALCYLIDRYAHAEEVTVEELMQFIPGPDFPTGGLIYRYQHENGADGEEQVDVIARAYASGRGRIVVQAKAHIEDMSRNRSRIVVTELPYQTNKTNLIERIAELVRDGRLEGVTDLRDESDRTGMRICIEMTRTVEPRGVLAELYKLTPLQSTFSISLLALVDGEPHLLSLKRLLLHFLEHRREVIRRRSEYDLAKALIRKEILEGLQRALDILDEVIALIRRSRTADVARQGLINEFKFTELQAQAILDMQLRRLAALERKKLQDEYKEVVALIKELGELLESPKKLLALIRKNLVDLKATYADPRRTQIADRVKGALTTMDVLPDQEVWVALGADGVLSRRPYEAITATGLKRTPAGAGAALIAANTRHDLYLLSARGQATRVAIHQIPEGGAHFADLSGLTRRDRVVAMHAVPKSQPDAPLEGHLVMATAQGQVKRVRLPDLSDQAHANPQVFNLDEKDELVWSDVSTAGGEVLLATAQGQMIRFPEEEVRAAGLPAGGVAGIKVQKRDRVVGGMLLPAGTGAEARLAVVTALGWGKQTPLAEFPVHGRGGQGVQAGRFSERTGALAGIALLGEDEALLCFTEGGAGRLVRSGEVPVASRATLGKALFAATVGATVRAVMAVAAGEPESTKPGEPRSQPAKAQGNARAVQPSLLPEDGAAAKPRRTRTAGKQPEPAAPTSAPKTPARKTAAKAAAAVAVSATVVKAATAEKPQPPPASRAKAGTTAPKAATGKSKPPAAEAPPPKPAAARSKPAAADAAIPAPKAGGAPSKPAAASKAEAAPSKPAAAPKAATAGAKTSAAPEAAPASPAKTGKAKEAPAKQPDAPPKPATRAKSAPEAGASGARVFDRSDLPRVMPAPKAQKDAAPAPPPEPGSTGKPAAKKKPAKPEA